MRILLPFACISLIAQVPGLNALPAPNPEDTAAIEGHVTSVATGAPLSNGIIVLRAQHPGKSARNVWFAETHPAGEFRIEGIPLAATAASIVAWFFAAASAAAWLIDAATCIAAGWSADTSGAAAAAAAAELVTAVAAVATAPFSWALAAAAA
ncbi:MAG: hypothetical protein ABUS49_07715, partial [Acidobacteriota bacterium]